MQLKLKPFPKKPAAGATLKQWQTYKQRLADVHATNKKLSSDFVRDYKDSYKKLTSTAGEKIKDKTPAKSGATGARKRKSSR